MCVSLSQLSVNGKDIIEAIPGIESRKIGELLSRLLLLVIDEKIDNDKRALLHMAQKILKAL